MRPPRPTTTARTVEAYQRLPPCAVGTRCSLSLAGIGELPDTVADRAIPIRLKRKARGEHVERFRSRDVAAGAEPLRERLASWAAENVGRLAAAFGRCLNLFSTPRLVRKTRAAIAEFDKPSGHQLEHLAFASGQPVEWVVATSPPDELRDDARIERRATAGHRLTAAMKSARS